MQPSQKCYDFIQGKEGFKLTAYQDSAEVWTIGIGSILYIDGSPVKKNDTITKEQAIDLFHWELEKKASKVNAFLIGTVVNQNQFDALVSFAYNVGTEALRVSTLLKLVKAKPLDKNIKDAFLVWNKAHVNGKLVTVKGLLLRRQSESDLYFTS